MVSFVRFIMAAFLRTLLIIVYCLLLLTRAVIAGATLPRPASHQGHYDSNNGFTPSQKFASFQTIPLMSVVSNPVSKATLGKRLRDGMERIWTFLSA